MSDDQMQIRALFAGYLDAYIRKDAVALTDHYSDDGAIFSPFGPAAVGREAILATHVEWLAENEQNKRMSLCDIRCDGDLAYCLAEYASEIPLDDGGLSTEAGTSVNVLQRQSNSAWKILTTSLNSHFPEPAGQA